MRHAERREGEREGARFPNHNGNVYCTCTIVLDAVQWNISNLDTNGAEQSNEVSSFQRLKCMQEWYLGWEKVSPVSSCSSLYKVPLDIWYMLLCIRDTAGVYYT